MELQGTKNRSVFKPWSNAYLVLMWRKSVENSGLQSDHEKNAFGPLVATNGITEHLISIGILTLVQGTYDLNLKKIGQELRDVEGTQEIYVVAMT